MSILSLREINQSQLDTAPVIDGQIIICLDTGNAYRDSSIAHVKIGNDLEVVSELPLAPLANKLYYIKPDKLYSYNDKDWILLNDSNFSIGFANSDNSNEVFLQLKHSSLIKNSITIKGVDTTSVIVNEYGQLLIRTPDPNIFLTRITEEKIDKLFGNNDGAAAQQTGG